MKTVNPSNKNASPLLEVSTKPQVHLQCWDLVTWTKWNQVVFAKISLIPSAAANSSIEA